MANTLYEYYGGKLPSLAERAKVFTQKGGQGAYSGTSSQNQWLLRALKGGGLPVGTIVAPTPPQDAVSMRRQALTDAQRSLEDPIARLNRVKAESGVSEAENTLTGLMRQFATQEELLTGLEPNINQRTGQFGMTEAQRQRLLASERAPIAEGLDKINRAKGLGQETLNIKQRAMQQVLEALGLADQQKLAPLQQELEFAERDAEVKRQLSEAAANRATKASTAKKPSKEDNISAISRVMAKVAGKDGYVSPSDYKAIKQEAKASGIGVNDFDELFYDFINPVHYQRGSGRESYGISTTAFNKYLRPKLHQLGIGYDD